MNLEQNNPIEVPQRIARQFGRLALEPPKFSVGEGKLEFVAVVCRFCFDFLNNVPMLYDLAVIHAEQIVER